MKLPVSFFISVLMSYVMYAETEAATACMVGENRFVPYENAVDKLLNTQIEMELQAQYTYLHLSHVFMQYDNYYPKVAAFFRAKSDEEMTHAEKFIEYQNRRGGKFNIGSVQRYTASEACEDPKSLSDAFTCAKRLEIEVTRALTNLASKVSDVKIDSDADTTGNVSELASAQSVLITVDGAGIAEETYPLSSFVFRSTCSAGDLSNYQHILRVEYVELAEMITHEFLGHQIEDTKELANYVETLRKFSVANDNSGQVAQIEKLGSYLFDKNL